MGHPVYFSLTKTTNLIMVASTVTDYWRLRALPLFSYFIPATLEQCAVQWSAHSEVCGPVLVLSGPGIQSPAPATSVTTDCPIVAQLTRGAYQQHVTVRLMQVLPHNSRHWLCLWWDERAPAGNHQFSHTKKLTTLGIFQSKSWPPMMFCDKKN